ncbi:hypothetical protein [Deinococcus sp. LM3]|uniref:hypothetical protein n=1 Tax=Deinococcus sp. LM3 TaxID=1938608 RepID=UPI00117D9EC3|nr:hypothetical protein [Deinococcus sp. LM3]
MAAIVCPARPGAALREQPANAASHTAGGYPDLPTAARAGWRGRPTDPAVPDCTRLHESPRLPESRCANFNRTRVCRAGRIG